MTAKEEMIFELGKKARNEEIVGKVEEMRCPDSSEEVNGLYYTDYFARGNNKVVDDILELLEGKQDVGK